MTTRRSFRLEAWTDPQCAGGTRTSILARHPQALGRELLKCETRRGVDGKDSLELQVPASNDALAAVEKGAVIRHMMDDGTFDEWRVESITTALSEDGSKVSTIVSRPLLLDLANVLVRRYAPSGQVLLATSLERATITEALTTYVLPWIVADGYSWITLGTIDDGVRYNMQWSGSTALEVVEYLRSLRPAGPLETQLRRVGTSGYALDMVYAINASAPTVDVRTKKNLRESRHTITTEGMATAVYTVGATRGDGVVSSLAGIVYRVEAVNALTKTLTLSDPENGLPPVGIDGMLDGMVLVSRRSNRGLVVLASNATTQEVTVNDIQGKDVGDALLLAESMPVGRAYPDPFVSTLRVPFEVTSVTSGTLFDDVFATDPFGTQFIAGSSITNLRWQDYWLSAGPRVLTTAVSFQDGATMQYTLASVTGIQVGDVGVRATNSSGADLGAITDGFTITAIDTVNKKITVAPRYRATAVFTGSGAISGFVHVCRMTKTVGIAVAGGGSESVTVEPGSGIVAGDWCEAWVNTAWDQASKLMAPAAQHTLSPRRHILGRVSMPDHTDEANLFSNGYLSDWDETPNGMPDGVFKSTGYEVPSAYRATGLRNTNPARVQLGTKSLRLRRARFGFVATGTSVTAGASAFSATGSSSTSATEPDFEPGAVVAFGSPLVETVTVATATYDAPNTRWNYTITGTFANSHAAGVLLQEYGLTPKHRFIMPPSGSVNLFASMFMEGPSDNSVTHTGRLVVSRPIAGGTTATVDTAVVNQWATVQVEGFQAPPGAMIEVQVQIVGSANERYSLWLDHIYAIESVDPEYFPATPPNYSNGNALYQAARRFLVERVNGVHTYDVRFIDLTRLDEGTWPNDAVLIGSYVRYTDPDTGQAVLLRILEVRTNHLMEAETSVTLSNNPYTLTSQVA